MQDHEEKLKRNKNLRAAVPNLNFIEIKTVPKAELDSSFWFWNKFEGGDLEKSTKVHFKLSFLPYSNSTSKHRVKEPLNLLLQIKWNILGSAQVVIYFFSCILEKPGWGWVWLKPFLFSFLVLNTMPKCALFTQTSNPNPSALLRFPTL